MAMTSELHHIRLELPREPGNPGGAQHGGYDIVATGWRLSSDRGGQDPDPPDDADDETRFRFSEASCELGEYVSLQAPDGATPTFRVGQLPAL